MRERCRNRQVRMSAFACSHPFLKSTDQPVKNFGSLVKRRTANSTKKKEMEPSANLKHSSAKEKSSTLCLEVERVQSGPHET